MLTPQESPAVSRVLGHGYPPPLDPAVENTTCTLRTDTDNTESQNLEHKTIAVISAVKTHTYISPENENPRVKMCAIEGKVELSSLVLVAIARILNCWYGAQYNRQTLHLFKPCTSVVRTEV